MSSVTSSPAKHNQTTPFLLRLFHRTGDFHRLDDFASPTLPPHVSVYTGPDCTLNELALELAASDSSTLPSPSLGTRLAFQLVYPDMHNTSTTGPSHPRFAVKDLGSIVIGEGGPGVELSEGTEGIKESQKSLGDAKFVVGDYISCAILPPLADGSVAPVPAVRRNPTKSTREGRGSYRGQYSSRGRNFARDGGRGGRNAWRDGGDARIPRGEWRRGERLPDSPANRYRGRSGC